MKNFQQFLNETLIKSDKIYDHDKEFVVRNTGRYGLKPLSPDMKEIDGVVLDEDGTTYAYESKYGDVVIINVNPISNKTETITLFKDELKILAKTFK